jgi:hypothetical protein
MRCKACHYDLSHLVEHRCPECSRRFDPADDSTFLHENSARWTLVSLCVLGATFVVGPLIVMLLLVPLLWMVSMLKSIVP